jgi:hypothetical protein
MVKRSLCLLIQLSMGLLADLRTVWTIKNNFVLFAAEGKLTYGKGLVNGFFRGWGGVGAQEEWRLW